jgi:hypothetical protein
MKQSEEREYNMSRVIAAALELFVSDGIYVTSINRVAQEAGLSPMSVYRYFKNKDTLVYSSGRTPCLNSTSSIWSATPPPASAAVPATRNTSSRWTSTPVSTANLPDGIHTLRKCSPMPPQVRAAARK